MLVSAGLISCRQKAPDQHPHEEAGLKSVSYTLYSNHCELFVEFKPLVVGSTSRFAAHLTRLGENFLPVTEGTVSVSLLTGTKGLKNTATAPASPGIFRVALQPTSPGLGTLVFDIQTKEFTDQIIIDSVKVYADEQSAMAEQAPEAAGTDISYLKEQAWKTEFANAPVTKQTFFDVIKATGEIISAPGDELVVASRSNGVVKFSGTANVIGSSIRAGQSMFTITGGEIPFENVQAAKQTATAELNIARSEYSRATELIKDKLITQAEFQNARLRFQQAEIAVMNLNRNYSAAGKTVSAPISGFVKNILVGDGQYVSAGQPLATLTKNQRLLLRADVSLKDAGRVSTVQEANFKLVQNQLTYNTTNLNGRLLSIGKTTDGNTPFIPVHFQIDSRPGLLPGSYAEVYLKTAPIYNVLVIPATALLEEQGNFYVYVQTGGESFQKRQLKLGANDGQHVQVLSGLEEGERIVTKGAYQIKLSQASGTMPAHGHEH
jgi:RND family efflux transporter MFP subunit